MRTMSGLVKYQLQQYFKTNKFVMPFAVLIILLYGNYSNMPADFVSCQMLSDAYVFLIMVWVGVTLCDLEYAVSEQIMILRVQSARTYYISQVLFALLLCLAVSAISIGVPLLQNLVNARAFFRRPVLFSDAAGGFFLLFFCAFAGTALGELAHPRLIKDRKTAVVCVFLLAMLSVLKGVITEKAVALKLVLWILPPIWEVSRIFADADYLYAGYLAAAGGILLLSGLFFTVVKIGWLEWRGF